jgi:tetratricopeptide (TPR) repeat protein
MDRPESAAAVYERLVPFATAESRSGEDPAIIMPNGQFVDPTTPYRYPFGPLPRPTVEVLATSAAYEPLSTGELEDVRDRARALAEEDRFTQAADLLATALRAAAEERAATEPDLLDMRLDLANLYMLAGAYREALVEFARLAADLAGQPRADRELVWHCRQQAAVCQAELGDVPAALAALRALLVDEQRALPADASQIFGLRQQIVTLAAGIGDVQGARSQLEALLADARRAGETGTLNVADLEVLLTTLARLDRALG